MNIVFVFPFCSPAINSISGGPIYLGSTDHNVLVITSRHVDSLKGKVDSPEHETIGGTEFYRPYEQSTDIIRHPFCCWTEISEKLAGFEPEVVICFGEFNYRLAVRISSEFDIPMFLYMEYLRPGKIAFPIRGRTALRKMFPRLHDYLASLFLKYLARRVKAIMFAYYGDRERAASLEKSGVPAIYVPWCAEVGSDPVSVTRERNVGIYIGSLEGFKNAAELVEAIPLILDKTETKRFIVVGPGAYAGKIQELADRYGNRLQYIRSMPREEAMKLVSSAGYGYTPVTDCGLGFIGDCWGHGTPLIATHELDGFLHSGEDTLIANDVEDLPDKINQLLDSEELFEKLSSSGRARFESDYTSRAAGERYLGVVQKYRDNNASIGST